MASFFSRKGKEQSRSKSPAPAGASSGGEDNKGALNQDATLMPKDSQQAINAILSTLTKEKYYSEEVVSRAIAEYIKGLEGHSENDKLALLVSSSNRTVNVRRMCIKALLIEAFQNSELESMERVEAWARFIFTKLEIRDNESLNKLASRYLLKLCSAISQVVSEGEFGQDDLMIALSKKEFFPPGYWSIAELNRQPLGTLPSEKELMGQLRRGAQAVSSLRSQAVDLNGVLDILIKCPHQFTGVVPVLLQPILAESKNLEESNKQLEASLAKIAEMIVWNDETMPLTIANLQKHPGIPLASEVAKCLPFTEMYRVIVTVVKKLLFSDKGKEDKDRGFDKCEIKLKYRCGEITLGELKEEESSITPAFSDSSRTVSQVMDMADPSKRDSKKPSVMDSHKSNQEPLCIRDFRRFFGLVPEAYDRDGQPLPQFSDKNRAHSFVANTLIVPVLKGMYEAKAKFLDLPLTVDAPFILRVKELEKEREETKSLDEKRVLKRTIGAVRRLHTRIVTVVQDCAGQNETCAKLELDIALSTANQFSLDVEELKVAALTDIAEVQKCPSKKPGEARKLIEMAKDAPEWAENVPPSSWTSFFTDVLPTLEEKLNDPGAVQKYMEEFSNLLSEQLSVMIASAIPVNEEAKDVIAKDPNFNAIVKTLWEITLSKQEKKVNEQIVRLLRDVFLYVQCSPEAEKCPDAICLKVIQISRPMVKTLMDSLDSVNANDLFKALKELIERNKGQAPLLASQ